MSTPDDVEYRLDADHIRSICQAVRPESAVHVTHVGRPPHVYVHAEWPHGTAELLNQVGYLTELPDNANAALVVTGWNTTQLNVRAAALAGILARWRDTLHVTAARAIDIYALNGTPSESWRHSAVRRAGLMLRREVEAITGPHAAHDPHIRPDDHAQARLIDNNQRLETAIADHIRTAERIATYAVTAYADDPTARTQPANARERAITHARARAITHASNEYAATIRHDRAERETTAQAPSASPDRDHPALIAANDQPTDTPAAPSTSTANGAGPNAAPEAPRRRTP